MPPALRPSYAGGQQINDDPPLYLFEQFVSQEEADHLVDMARSQLSPSLVSGEGEGVPSEGRSGGVHWVPHNTTPITQALSERVAYLVGLPLENCESIQVIHYSEGEEYKPHFDAWLENTDTGRRCLARGGQRLVTCLAYLSEVEAGGGTFFPKLDVEVMPRQGRLVLFHNCYQGSSDRHPSSLHGGLPVLSGEKWACNFWFRESAYRYPQSNDLVPTATTRRY